MFIIAHVVVLQLDLSEGALFAAILLSINVIQTIAYKVLKSNSIVKLSFKEIFTFLALTQVVSVLVLTLYSILLPSEPTPPVELTDLVASLAIFALVLPGMIILAIMLINKRRETALTTI